MIQKISRLKLCFNSRTREGATCQLFSSDLSKPVSIHAPVRVRLDKIKNWNNKHSFNSRTREGATQKDLQKQIFQRVSIHAPVRVRQHRGYE